MDRAIITISLAALLSVTVFGGAALAGDTFSADGVTISGISSDPSSLPGDGEVNVSMQVSVDTNRAAGGISDCVVQGDAVQSCVKVDLIDIGASAAMSFVLKLGSAQLGSPVQLTLVWKDSGGGLPFTVTIPSSSPVEPKVEFTRTVDKTMVDKGGAVILTYVVNNTGKVDITDLAITDDGVGPQLQFIEPSLAAGSSVTKTFTFKVYADFTSSPKLSYNALGNPYTATCPPRPVSLKVVELTAALSVIAPEIVEPGQEVTLVCDLANTGSVKMTDIVIGEPTLGSRLFPPVSLDAGDSMQFSRTVVLPRTTKYQYVVTARDDSGSPYQTKSNELEAVVNSGLGQYNIEIVASPDALQLAKPGKVSFAITVTNKGAEAVPNVVVKTKFGEVITHYDSLAVGVSEFTYEENIDKTTSFDFSIIVSGADGDYVRSTGLLQIRVVEPAATATEASPTLPDVSADSRSVDGSADSNSLRDIVWAMIAVGVLIVVTIVVLLAMLVSDKIRKRKR